MPDLTTSSEPLAEEIARWIRDQIEQSGAERAVLGLSGGIDSAVVCALCAKAIGAERVLGAIMPSQSIATDAEHAHLVAQTFGVPTVQVDLTDVFATFLTAMPPMRSSDEPLSGEVRRDRRESLAIANLKPRLRMTTLYYLANRHNGLVVGTGNKSEAMVGYFTKYGDGGVDLLPIVDLYKHEVRSLARALGVPEPIVAKPPSAGLWQGQTDEAELGISYDQLDMALTAIARGDRDSVETAIYDRVLAMVRATEHKRRPIPAFRRDTSTAG